jgi:hypothetical protein
MELYPMRKVAIERALSRGSIEEAKFLAHEGIRQAEKDKYPGYISDYRDVLMRCAEREGDKEGVYAIAIQLFLDSHMDPFSYYRRAKKCAGSAWHTRLPEVICVLEKQRGKYRDLYKLANLYIEEKMWQELLMLVENNPELSSAYGKRLEKRFPKEIAHVYALMVQKGMDIPRVRSAYQAQCDILRTIRNLGCPELVERIVSAWREQYPRRRALMEELDRL